MADAPPRKGFPGVNPRVVALWVGLAVAIAALVAATDYLSPRNRHWPVTTSSQPATAASSQPAPAAAPATAAASAAAPK